MSWLSSLIKALSKAAAEAQQPPPPAAVKPRATVAFHVVDADSRPIPIAIITFEDGTKYQVNDDGYVAIEKELNTYFVHVSAEDYTEATRSVVLTGNRQFEVTLKSTKPAPVPVPPPVPVPAPVPVPVPPPAPSAPVTDEEFKAAFFAILKKHKAPRACNLQTLNDTKDDVEAIGCEWQHTSGGELRPRLFLPVPPGADPYGRAYDVGLYGQPWDWIKRY